MSLPEFKNRLESSSERAPNVPGTPMASRPGEVLPAVPTSSGVGISPAASRIHLVDDGDAIRKSIGGWLAKNGYTVETSADLPEFFTALERTSY